MTLRARKRSYGPRRRKLARFGSCSAYHPYAHLRLRAVIRWSLLSHKRRAGGMVHARGWCTRGRAGARRCGSIDVFTLPNGAKNPIWGVDGTDQTGLSASFGNRTLAIRSVMRQRPRLCCGVRQWAACETVATAVAMDMATAVGDGRGDSRGDGHGDGRCGCRRRWAWALGIGLDARPSRQHGRNGIWIAREMHEAGSYRHLGACGCR